MNEESITEGQTVDSTRGTTSLFGKKKKYFGLKIISQKSEDELQVNVWNACIYAVRTAKKITLMNEVEKESFKVSWKRLCWKLKAPVSLGKRQKLG